MRKPNFKVDLVGRDSGRLREQREPVPAWSDPVRRDDIRRETPRNHFNDQFDEAWYRKEKDNWDKSNVTIDEFITSLQNLIKKNQISAESAGKSITVEIKRLFLDSIISVTNNISTARIEYMDKLLFDYIQDIFISMCAHYKMGTIAEINKADIINTLHKSIDNAVSTMGYAGNFNYTGLMYGIFKIIYYFFDKEK